jgi:hypothetical protein
VFEESPSSANEYDSDKKYGALQQMGDVVENSPRFDVKSFGLDKMKIDSVKS